MRHYPLESLLFECGAIALPGSETARQDALNGASIEVHEGLKGQAKFLQPPEVEEALLPLFFTTLSVWVDHFRLSVMCTPRN